MKITLQYDNEFVTLDLGEDANIEQFLKENYEQRLAEAPEEKKSEVVRYNSIQEWAEAMNRQEWNAYRRFYNHAAPTVMPMAFDGSGRTKVDEEEMDSEVPFNSIEYFGNNKCDEDRDKAIAHKRFLKLIHETLNENQEQIILLRYVEGYKVIEIAEMLDKTPDAITKTLRRAEAQMKKVYEKLGW